MVFLGMWMVYRVVKENSFASATIEVVQNQWVISTGPYAVVRNPMYSSTLVYIEKNLSGYTEYCAKVRWHLIPLIF